MGFMKKEDYTKYLSFFALVFVMICAYVINSHRSKMNEVARLPFYNVDLSQVEDGTYSGKTYTTFAHVQVEVTVKNGKLVNIVSTECEGAEVGKAAGVLQEMVLQNKIVVSAKKGQEIGTMVFISCVDCALHGKDDVISEVRN